MNKFIPAILLLILAAALYYGLSLSDTNRDNKADTAEHTSPPSKDEAATQTNPDQTAIDDDDTHTETFTREEVDHAFGTEPGKVYYPPTAIDTDDIPSIAIEESVSATQPLHYYQVAPDTYLFYGNIAEVDENNRGFNGNAGFVITADSVVVIDSLGTPKLGKRMIATIRSITRKPIKYLIVTHNHPDHA